MLTLDLAKWQQTPEDLRQLSLISEHPRTRERFLALYELTQQQQGASLIARRTERHPQTPGCMGITQRVPTRWCFAAPAVLPLFVQRMSKRSMPCCARGWPRRRRRARGREHPFGALRAVRDLYGSATLDAQEAGGLVERDL